MDSMDFGIGDPVTLKDPKNYPFKRGEVEFIGRVMAMVYGDHKRCLVPLENLQLDMRARNERAILAGEPPYGGWDDHLPEPTTDDDDQ